MLEHSHNEAYTVVAQRAARLVSEGKLDDAVLPEKQMVAIRELENARKAIFAKHGVSDVIPTNEWQVLGRLYTLEQLRELNPELLKIVSFGQRLKIIRLDRRLSKQSLVDMIKDAGQSLSIAAISRMEGDKMIVTTQSVRKIILGFGLEENDWTARLLLEKSKESRRQKRIKNI